MLIRNTFCLLCGLVLFSIFQAPASASHNYTFHFLVDNRYIDLSKYYVKIFPPQGYAPNSSCMQIWQTPSTEVTLDALKTELTVTIEDKNSGSCLGSPKYNTWNYQILPTPLNPLNDPIKALGSIQFYHVEVGGDWYTAIMARNNDGIPRNKPSVGFATCYDKSAQTNCLNRATKGKDAANEVFIYFRWPVNEN
ncbi:hypothetical protein [Bordetella sp. LUAb4]|uniref:hypothetical protein n=1 Tax=Bordetella sp. LUAb4 TaxID=2843195 RepID=UPI001E31AB19|nr:hypothetical protein [Bordetella sp. LUAb4]